MIQAEIRKKENRKGESMFRCWERNTTCFKIDPTSGTCTRGVCLLDDPEHIAQEARIEKNRQKNAERERIERAREKAERENPIIRRQTKTKDEILRDKIIRVENQIQQAYRRGRTRKGDALTKELLRLNAEMRKIK